MTGTANPTSFIFLNAKIFTANPDLPYAEAAVVQGQRIAYVGSNAQALTWQQPATRIVDCQQHTLMPGIIDSHFHLLQGCLHLDGMQLDQATEYESLASAIRNYAGQFPDRPWLNGYGLKYQLGPSHQPLNRHYLDAIVGQRPLVLFAYDFHTAWANTLALQLAGILQGGEAGPNSEIMLDAQGMATGELREHGAFDHVQKLLPPPDDYQKRALLKLGLQQLAAAGVTSVHNMDGSREQASLYAALEDTGELSCRVYIPYSVKPDTPFEALAAEAASLKAEFQSAMVRGGAVKFFMDGVIESYTGLMVEAYADNPNTYGAANYAPEHFNKFAIEADRLGLQIAVHACGDLAVRRALDGYELAQQQNGLRDSRHRVEHIEVIHPDDIDRFQKLGVTASMQPLHAPPGLGDGDIWPQRVGPQRWPLCFAWQTLRQAGARLAFGSDWPVVSFNPMQSIQAAVCRQPWAPGLPDQHQTLADTLIAYTRDAAWTEFAEHEKGQVREGYLADLVLLSDDIFAVPPQAIGTLNPVLTLCDGRIVYEA